MSNLALRPFRDRTTFTEARLSPEELQQFVEDAAEAGTVDKATGEIASRAIDLARLKAYSVMVPRNEVVWLPLGASTETIRNGLREIPTFPEQAPVVEILRALQRARTEIGLIVDETGFPSGLVSIETTSEAPQPPSPRSLLRPP